MLTSPARDRSNYVTLLGSKVNQQQHSYLAKYLMIIMIRFITLQHKYILMSDLY